MRQAGTFLRTEAAKRLLSKELRKRNRKMDKERKSVYMDHAATGAVRELALSAMLPYLKEQFGNPSSLHGPGLAAKKAIQEARAKIAGLLGCNTNEILYTAGGTEADNWAIKGYLLGNPDKGKHIITSAIEHPAVLRTSEFMKRFGYELTVLTPDRYGIISADALRTHIRPDTALITIQTANNEIGTIEPIDELATVAKDRGVAFHTDAVQAVGTLAIDLKKTPVTMLSASGHKFGAPKGVGFLYVKDGTKLESLLHGGSQEKRMRAGTENVPGIVAMAEALSEALASDYRKTMEVRDYMQERILREIPDTVVNGWNEADKGVEGSKAGSYSIYGGRLPGSLSVSFGGVEASSVLVFLDLAGIAASGGSACSSAENKPSEVLQAIGVEEPYLSGTVRFSLSADNMKEEADYVVEVLKETVRKLRNNR